MFSKEIKIDELKNFNYQQYYKDELGLKFIKASSTKDDEIQCLSSINNVKIYKIIKAHWSLVGQYMRLNAKEAIKLLDLLVASKNNWVNSLTVSDTKLREFLSNLEKNGHISTAQAEHFIKEIPTKLSLKEKEDLVKETKDFAGALELAHYYRADIARSGQNLMTDSRKKSTRALTWLKNALIFESKESIQDKSLNDFLNVFEELKNSELFDFMPESLLNALIRNNSIKIATFGSSPPESINKNCAIYLAQTKSLEYLDLWFRGDDSSKRLQKNNLAYIAEGLKYNTSLKQLDLRGQPIDDEDLGLIFDALAQNPQTQLNRIEFSGNMIKKKGLDAIEACLNKNTSLTYISGGQRFKMTETIERITEINKETRMYTQALDKLMNQKEKSNLTDRLSSLFVVIELGSKYMQNNPLQFENFLQEGASLESMELFEKADNPLFQPLYSAFIKCDPVVRITDHSISINNDFSTYLSQTKNLKSLNLVKRFGFWDINRNLKSFNNLTSALKLNTSLEELNLSKLPIEDKGLNILLDALESNPKIKLKKLILMNTDITEKGLRRLEDFLKNNTTLIEVDLRDNYLESTQAIDLLVQKNRALLVDEVDDEEQCYPLPIERPHSEEKDFGLFAKAPSDEKKLKTSEASYNNTP